MKYLVFDAGNILYRTFYAHRGEDDHTLAGLASHIALLTLNKYYKQHKPCKVIMGFDRHSWRKDYTASDDCVSKKPYKGNRRQNMTESEQEKFERYLQHIAEFEEMIRDYTSIIALANDGLEADDIIAGVINTLSVTEPNAKIVVVSQDKDLIQLLRHNNVRLIDPSTGHDRTLKDWDNDADLFMFEKCLRGDPGDYVQSAYPRIRKTRIVKAYSDEFEKANVMAHEWPKPDSKTDSDGNPLEFFKVQDLFKENILLMDLDEQPDHIQKLMVMTVLDGLANPGRFDYFNFLKYLGIYDLERVAENVETFVPMLSS